MKTLRSIVAAVLALALCSCEAVREYPREQVQPGFTLKPRVELAVAKRPDSRALFTEVGRSTHQIARTRNVLDGHFFAQALVMQETRDDPYIDAALFEYGRLVSNAYLLHGNGSVRTFTVMEAIATAIDEALRGTQPYPKGQRF